MESLACDTPVVADVWVALEIITSANVGLLVNRMAESIASGLIKALNRQWDRHTICKHVSSRAWDIVAGDVKEIFSTIL